MSPTKETASFTLDLSELIRCASADEIGSLFYALYEHRSHATALLIEILNSCSRAGHFRAHADRPSTTTHTGAFTFYGYYNSSQSGKWVVQTPDEVACYLQEVMEGALSRAGLSYTITIKATWVPKESTSAMIA